MNLPVPFLRESVPAGDFVRRMTDALRVPPCGGCRKRQAYLNERITLVPMRPPETEEEARGGGVIWED